MPRIFRSKIIITMSKHKANKFYNRALIVPDTLNDEKREVEVIFATETPVFRWGWDEDYNEVLVCDKSNVRMDRINKGLPVLDGHDFSSIFKQIGRTVDVRFENNQGIARIALSERCDDLYKDIRDGIIKDVSVGYRVFKFDREPIVDGEKYPTYRATDWEPYEISLTPVPADPNSGVRNDSDKNEVQIVDKFSSNKKRNPMITVVCPECGAEFDVASAGEHTCTNCGAVLDFSDSEAVEVEVVETGDEGERTVKKTVTRAKNLKTVKKRSKTPPKTPPTTPPTTPPVDIEAIRSQANADGQRRLDAILVSTRKAKLDDAYAIELFKSEKPLEECRQAIIDKWAAKDTPTPNGTHTAKVEKDAIDGQRQLAAEAIAGRAIPSKFAKDVKADNPFRGRSIPSVLRSLMNARGMNTNSMSDVEVVNLAFQQRAYSTSDLPLLMEDVMNKILRGDYTFAPEHWKTIARQKLVPDYREQPFYQFETENGIKEIPEGGEIPYTRMIEAKQTIRIKDYGEGFKLTRQAIINDDLDVFSRIPERFVKDHDEFCGDMVWNMIINNIMMFDGKPLFDNSHLNVVTGAGSVFGETGLTSALQIFRGQKALGGKRRINIEPRYLIVPTELEIPARKQLTAIMASTTADVNVFQNAFELIVERRLTDPNAWYLMADPASVDGLYYANLQGEEGLRANREEKFNTDTIDYAVRFNFGTAAIDWRGIVKMTGVTP